MRHICDFFLYEYPSLITLISENLFLKIKSMSVKDIDYKKICVGFRINKFLK